MAKSKNRSKTPVAQNRPGQTKIWLWLVPIIAIVILAAAGLSLFGGPPAAAPAAAFPAEISIEQAHQKYEEGVFVLDVRTPAEWEDFHAPNTTLIPLNELESRLAEVPKDQEVVVICRSGNRSQAGRDILRQAGYEQVSSVAGGLNAWRNAGYPVE